MTQQSPISEAFIRIRYAVNSDELRDLRQTSDRTFGRMRQTATSAFAQTRQAARRTRTAITQDFRRTEQTSTGAVENIASRGRQSFQSLRRESDRALSGIRQNINEVQSAFGSGGLVGGLTAIPGALAGVGAAVAGVTAAIVTLDKAVSDIRQSNVLYETFGVDDPRRVRTLQRDVLQVQAGLEPQEAAELVRTYVQSIGSERFNEQSDAVATRDLLALSQLQQFEPLDSERLARIERAFGQGQFADAARQAVYVSQQGGLSSEVFDTFVEDAGRFRGAGYSNNEILSAQLAAIRATDLSAQDLNVVYDQVFVKLAEDRDLQAKLGISDISQAREQIGSIQTLIERVTAAQGADTTAEQIQYVQRTRGIDAFERQLENQTQGIGQYALPEIENRQGFFGRFRTNLTTDISRAFDDFSLGNVAALVTPYTPDRSTPTAAPEPQPVTVQVEITDRTDRGVSAAVDRAEVREAFGLTANE